MRAEEHLRPQEANFQPLSPVGFLTRAVEAHPARQAVIWRDMSWDYAEFHAMARRMADRLIDEGVKPGDVVSIIARNRPEMLAAHYAVPAIGAVLNTLNTRLDHGTLEYIFNHAGTRLLIVDQGCADVALEAARSADVPWLILTEPGARAGRDEWDLIHDTTSVDGILDGSGIADEWQPICLNYTSGTTGHPKGVVYHARGAYLNALGNALTLGFGPSTRYLWTLPMFHCNGWSHTWAVTAAGGTHICLDAVEPAVILDLCSRLGVTHLCCAPVVLYMLLSDPAAEMRKGATNRVAVGTGGAAPSAHLIAALDELGFDLTHLYGLTESYGPASICQLSDDLADADPKAKAQFLARQGVRHATSGTIRIVDVDSHRDVPLDGITQGEIWLRGNTIMAGYYGDSDTSAVVLSDGWLRTGDLAVRDPDGAIRITDRAKDVVISGGENISSLEVEGVLQSHFAVLLAAIVAKPSQKWGETPCAFIELKPGATVRPDELIAFCRDHLAGFKIPRVFVFGELPKTATGKIQKFILRGRAREMAGDDD